MPASSKTALSNRLSSYRHCAKAEGKSQKTIDMISSSVSYLENFLGSEGLTTDAAEIGTTEIRAFILHLKGSKRFINHPYAKEQDTTLSAHAVNAYLWAYAGCLEPMGS